MKQVSKEDPAKPTPDRNDIQQTQWVHEDLFKPTVSAAAAIAGADSAILACLEPAKPASVYAVHGVDGVCPRQLADWVNGQDLDGPRMVFRQNHPFKDTWACLTVVCSASGRSVFLFILGHRTGTSIADKSLSLLQGLLTQASTVRHRLSGSDNGAGDSDGTTTSNQDGSEQLLLNALLDHVPDRIYIKDDKGTIVACTQAFAEAHGYEKKEQLHGSRAIDLYPEAFAADISEEEENILRTGTSIVNRAQRSMDRLKNEIWLSVTKVPNFSREGKITGLIGIARDITELKRSEAEIAEARDAAMESARVKSSFLANMSHELRTPLNGIIGMGTLLRSTQLSSEQQEIVGTMHESADSLLSIINEVLDFSRGEAGKMRLNDTEFHPNQVLNSILDLFSEPARAKQIELLGVPLRIDAPSLVGDAGKLRQVLVNLLGNALKFTHEGSVTIQMEEQITAENGKCMLEVVVRDTGIGIESDAIKSLFEPFTQADSSTTRKFGGTGLGLAISKQIIELMDGQIGARKADGGGAEFWFQVCLPVVFGTCHIPAPVQSRRLLGLLPESKSSANLQFLVERLGHEIETASPDEFEPPGISQGSPEESWDMVIVSTSFLSQLSDSTRKIVTEYLKDQQSSIVLLRSPGETNAEGKHFEFPVATTLSTPVKQDRLSASIETHASSGTTMRFASTPAETEDTALYRRRHGLGSQRVLVVEENSSNQRLLIELLDRIGFRADPVSSGSEAIFSLQRIHYPVILVGCNMSDMDGFETIQRIRDMEQNTFADTTDPRSQIIGMSNRENDCSSDRCSRVGMDDCIVFPVTKEELKTAMAEAVCRLKHSSPRQPVNVMARNQPSQTGSKI